jgi:phosphate/sulfate permease
MSNIAVFLPRSLTGGEVTAVCLLIVAGLGIMLVQGGEKIQKVVDSKSRVKDVPEATLVDFLFAIVLFVFKMISKIPMSTTWCFVGLLAGREISFAIRKIGDSTIKKSFKMSAKDLSAVILGFVISLIVGVGANSVVRDGFFN